MPRIKLPRVQSGQAIAADHINALYEALEGLGIDVPAGSGLLLSGGTFRSTRRRGMFAKLTSTAGTGASATYAWTEQVRVNGAWVDGARSGTTTSTPARKANGTAALTTFPYYVWIWQYLGEWLFFASDC